MKWPPAPRAGTISRIHSHPGHTLLPIITIVIIPIAITIMTRKSMIAVTTELRTEKNLVSAMSLG